MYYVSGSCVLAIMLVTTLPAAAQQVPKDPCAVLTQADLDAVVGKGAKGTPVGEEQCNLEGPVAEYEVQVRRSNGATELKDWIQFTLVKPVAPLKDVGDEAFVDAKATAAAFRKGNVAVRVQSAGVQKTAPMPYQQGVVELTKRIAARLK